MTEVRAEWENAVIDGVFPLRRLLSGSEHSIVFLTEARDHSDAVIKLIPSDSTLAHARISQLREIAALDHPHLIRLLDSGHCRFGGDSFLFVVMENAEQGLDQVLSRRALTAEEARDMLPPALDALSFLHRNNWVHGRLKPQNFLVVDDRLKLASDTIRASGRYTALIGQRTLYDPPEAADGAVCAAGDVWGLGITLVEALTQRVPAWGATESAVAGAANDAVAETLPAEFADVVRRCLSRDPADRPTIAALEAELNPRARTPVIADNSRAQREPAAATPLRKSHTRRTSVMAIAVVLILVPIGAVWFGLRLFQSHSASQKPADTVAHEISQPASAPTDASGHPPAAIPAPAAALHEDIPVVARSALASIHGHVKVAVSVTVDRSGNVTAATLKDPGPSQYFARVAATASRNWKFPPADAEKPRQWLLRFEFTRSGATGHAVPQS